MHQQCIVKGVTFVRPLYLSTHFASFFVNECTGTQLIIHYQHMLNKLFKPHYKHLRSSNNAHNLTNEYHHALCSSLRTDCVNFLVA